MHRKSAHILFLAVLGMLVILHFGMGGLTRSWRFHQMAGFSMEDVRVSFGLERFCCDPNCFISGSHRRMTRLAFRGSAALAITLVTAAMKISLNRFGRCY